MSQQHTTEIIYNQDITIKLTLPSYNNTLTYISHLTAMVTAPDII